jgi:hypothetical protein
LQKLEEMRGIIVSDVIRKLIDISIFIILLHHGRTKRQGIFNLLEHHVFFN